MNPLDPVPPRGPNPTDPDPLASRVPLALTLAIALALGLRIWEVWPDLPETMASHFGVSGRPDAFMSKHHFFVVMAWIGGGSIASLFVAPALMRRLPAKWINLPNRDYWLADAARRETAIARMANSLHWMAAATTALLAVAIELAIRANLERTNFAHGTFMVFLVGYFVFVIGVVLWKRRVFDVPSH
jgi:uncharacterized membrane protein